MAENMDPNWMGTGTEEEEIYKENIIDHFRKPHNFGILDKYSFKHKEFNPICGDNFELFVQIVDNKVKDVKFKGSGCAISTAATSMLTDKIKGMYVEELNEINTDDVMEMIGIPLGVVRRKCGLLCLKTLKKGLHEWGGSKNGETYN